MVALGAALAAKCRRVLFLWQRLSCGRWTTWGLRGLCGDHRGHAGTTRTRFGPGVGAPSAGGCRQAPLFREQQVLGSLLPYTGLCWGVTSGSPPALGVLWGPG